MKTKTIILIFAVAFSISCGDDQKRQKRDFVPIEPKNNNIAQNVTQKDSNGIELPTKDLTYYGPDSSLFPMVEFPTNPKIKFSQ